MSKTIVNTTPQLAAATAWLQSKLSAERFDHSLGAYQKAIELAERFQVSPEELQSAALGALLHDCAKLLSPQQLIDYGQKHRLNFTAHDLASPQVLHARVGAHWVETDLGLTHPDVLAAIAYHTTGRAGMSVPEILVYIADKIEGNTRNPLYTKKVTALLETSTQKHFQRHPLMALYGTMQFLLDSTIQFLVEKNQLIHPLTLEARNDVLHWITTHA